MGIKYKELFLFVICFTIFLTTACMSKVHEESFVFSYALPTYASDKAYTNGEASENNQCGTEIRKAAESCRITAFDFVRQIYESINFYGGFKWMAPETHALYIDKYYSLISLDRSFFSYGDQRNKYLDEHSEHHRFYEGYDHSKYTYLFFDFNGDGIPDIGIHIGNLIYIISYCKEQDIFIELTTVSQREVILGTNRIARFGGTANFYYMELLKDDEVCSEISFYIQFHMSGGYNEMGEEIDRFFLGVPVTTQIPREIMGEFTLKPHGIYYFEVTEDEWYNLVGDFFSSWRLSKELISAVSFSYEELFSHADFNDKVEYEIVYEAVSAEFVETDAYTNQYIRISYPQIRGLASETVEGEINDTLKKVALEALNWFESFDDMKITVSYSITLASNELLSVFFIVETFHSAQAYPLIRTLSANFLLESGTRLWLPDILDINEVLFDSFFDLFNLSIEYESLETENIVAEDVKNTIDWDLFFITNYDSYKEVGR